MCGMNDFGGVLLHLCCIYCDMYVCVVNGCGCFFFLIFFVVSFFLYFGVCTDVCRGMRNC